MKAETELIMDWDEKHNRLLWTVWSGFRSRARGVIFIPPDTPAETTWDFARERIRAWEQREWTRIGPHDFLRWKGQYPAAVRELQPDGTLGRRLPKDVFLLRAFSSRPPAVCCGYVVRGSGVRSADGWVAAAAGRGGDWMAIRVGR